MKTSSYALLTLIVCAAMTFLVWLHYTSLGFPDGHLTELERARKPYLLIFCILSAIGAVCGLVLSLAPSIQAMKKWAIHRWARTLFVLTVVLIAVLLIVLYWTSLIYDHGGGG